MFNGDLARVQYFKPYEKGYKHGHEDAMKSLQDIFFEPHFLGMPVIAGGHNYAINEIIVARDWYNRLRSFVEEEQDDAR